MSQEQGDNLDSRLAPKGHTEWLEDFCHVTQVCEEAATLCWLGCFVYPWLCVSLFVPYSLGNHAQLDGSSFAERLRSTMAYGWVERCSDIASCETSSLQDKYS